MTKKSTKDLYSSFPQCCGCELCAQSCPKGIISMQKDAEGFLYPVIKDNSECIGCNLCQKVCPIKNAGNIHSSFRSAYAGWSMDDDQLVSSSSGGAATALAEAIIDADGVVYGVAYSADCKKIEYVRVSEKESLQKLKTSKYAQATKAGILPLITDDLKAGKKVLFIGVPCDCSGIMNALGKYENLMIVSLVCHGPTSQAVHEQYCATLEKERASEISQFSVRYKKDGLWKPYYIHANFKDGSEYMKKFEDSPYNKAFLFFKRPSCNECVFKVDKFVADLLIGDFHAAKPGTETYNEKGVSSILVLTERGEELLQSISDYFFMKEVGMKISTHQIAINRPVKRRANRKQFSSVFVKKGLTAASGLISVKLMEAHDQIVTHLKVTGVKVKRLFR